MTGPILLAAGGTGGHLFPAEALARALLARGVAVELVTDARALAYSDTFPAQAVHCVPSATPTGGSPIAKALAALTLGRGTLVARGLVGRVAPAAVVGFGGYPTVPPMLAATFRGVPTILHEQNAVIGRANAFLARRATAIATGFPALGRASKALATKATHTGNPVRPAVLEAAKVPYPATDGTRLRLLVTGGSQGARVMSDVVPLAVARLDRAARDRLLVVQQARVEDAARVRATYAEAKVEAEVSPFFPDLPARIANAHLVVARGGASTVSELAVVGRPSILVPFPHALDQDQAANARLLEAAGGARVVAQTGFDPAWLAGELTRVLADPSALEEAAARARTVGVPDAAERLADLVMAVTGLSTQDMDVHEAAA